jgi:hypothetical protein
MCSSRWARASWQKRNLQASPLAIIERVNLDCSKHSFDSTSKYFPEIENRHKYHHRERTRLRDLGRREFNRVQECVLVKLMRALRKHSKS